MAQLPHTDNLLLELADGWLTIWFNRPESRNALAAVMTDELCDVLRCAPDANAVTKEMVLATRHLDRPQMLRKAAQAFASCMLSDEGREGVASFLEKREPSWVGGTDTRGGVK
jgi:enoyl-CoA hydratase/carnithine racemase